MHPRKQAILELKENGYHLHRQGAKHEVYRNDTTGEIIPLKRHDFDESCLRYIRKEIQSKATGRH